MQIDFHHAVTYVALRLGGLPHADAATAAHAAQYVDDATSDGPITFTTGQRYTRVTSAHKTLDIFENASQADNRLVWVPFHFLPGNESPPGLAEDEAFLQRMMCKPNSAVAQAMMHDCIQNKSRHAFALHRFGVALHTFMDTFAHQQFVGVKCHLNRLDDVRADAHPDYTETDAYDDITSAGTRLAALGARLLPIGHGGAVTFPDLPFLQWRFTRSNGQTVVRDNPRDFLAATQAAYNMARRWVAGDETLPDEALPAADAAEIEHLIRHTVLLHGEDRHAVWLNAISEGRFSFGRQALGYIGHGDGSWKHQALGVDPEDESDAEFTFSDAFLQSDWKRFHDAVQHQRLFILHDLLPRFGLCAS